MLLFKGQTENNSLCDFCDNVKICIFSRQFLSLNWFQKQIIQHPSVLCSEIAFWALYLHGACGMYLAPHWMFPKTTQLPLSTLKSWGYWHSYRYAPNLPVGLEQSKYCAQFVGCSTFLSGKFLQYIAGFPENKWTKQVFQHFNESIIHNWGNRNYLYFEM